MKLNANARIFIALFLVSIATAFSQGIKIRDLPTAPSPSLSDYLPEANATGTPTTYKVTPNSLLGLRTLICTPPLFCNGSSSMTLGADRTLSISGPNARTWNIQCVNVGATDTAAWNAAKASLDAAQGGIIHLSGTCTFTGSIGEDQTAGTWRPMIIEGDGRRATNLNFTSCDATGCVYFNCNDGIGSGFCDGFGLRDLTVNSVPSASTAIHYKNLQGPSLYNVYSIGGDTALSVEECRYGDFQNMYIWSPITNGVKIIGENYSASRFAWIDISTSGSAGSGFTYTKTGTNDAGGIYLSNVVINGTWAGSGIVFNSTSLAPIFPFLDHVVTDGNFSADGIKLVKVQYGYITQAHSTNQASTSGASALTLDGSQFISVVDGEYYGLTGTGGSDISLKNSNAKIALDGPRLLGNQQALKVDSTTHDVTYQIPSFATATLTNDPTKLVPSTSVSYSSPPMLHTGTTKPTMLGMISPAGSLAQYLAVDSSGVRKYYADNGTTVLETLSQAGAAAFTGAVTGSNLSGTNTGDQTITLTGDVTGSGTGSFATTLGSTYKGWTDSGTTVNTTTSTDKVGIGTSSADSLLEITANAAALQAPTLTGTVAHLSNADGTSSRLLIDSYGTANPATDYRAAAGTAASSSAVGSGVTIGQVTWSARGTTAYPSGSGATINGVTEEAQTDSAHGIAIVFKTTPNGTASNREVLRIDNAGHMLLSGTTPTVACTGTGTSPAAPTIDSGGTDQRFTVTMNTGTGSPGNTGTCTVTFASAFAAIHPIVCMLVKGASSWGNSSTIMETTESASAPVFTWTNIAGGTPTALTVSTSYKFSCIGGF